MRLAVVGTGYVGLVAGTCLADCGNDVICVDNDQSKVDKLKSGIIPIYEPGLEELVMRNQTEQRLVFSTDLSGAVAFAEVIFIAVGTPPSEDGSADLTHVLNVAREIAKEMRERKIIVIKSTVPAGTAAEVTKAVESITDVSFAVISNPEFLKEGAAIEDFTKPDRVVLGGSDLDALETMKDLYAPFVRTGNPVLVMDNVSAEMVKYASNAMLATRISFVNEIANLCERMGADISHVREGMGLDRRVGPSFLFPGAGFGGSCFPKDLRAIIALGEKMGYPMMVAEAVQQVNDCQKRVLFEKLRAYFEGNLKGKKVAMWGFAFKPKTDDIREAPAQVITDLLLASGCRVAIYDPEAMEAAKAVYGDRIEYADSCYKACEGADALLVVTEWNEFRRPDFVRIKELLTTPLIIDGRNLYHPLRMAAQGFDYFAIGRPHVSSKKSD